MACHLVSIVDILGFWNPCLIQGGIRLATESHAISWALRPQLVGAVALDLVSLLLGLVLGKTELLSEF